MTPPTPVEIASGKVPGGDRRRLAWAAAYATYLAALIAASKLIVRRQR